MLVSILLPPTRTVFILFTCFIIPKVETKGMFNLISARCTDLCRAQHDAEGIGWCMFAATVITQMLPRLTLSASLPQSRCLIECNEYFVGDYLRRPRHRLPWPSINAMCVGVRTDFKVREKTKKNNNNLKKQLSNLRAPKNMIKYSK